MLPKRPEPFNFQVGWGELPEGVLPKNGIPRSSSHIATVYWSWSPSNDLKANYYISKSNSGNHWVLWFVYDDNEEVDEGFQKSEWQSAGCVENADICERAAAIYLLLELWKWEATGDSELDRFHEVDSVTLISIEELDEIADVVWGGKL